MPLSTRGSKTAKAKREAQQRSWLVRKTALAKPHLRALNDVKLWQLQQQVVDLSSNKDRSADIDYAAKLYRREYPQFSDEQVQRGRYLGAGGFGIVHAVQGFDLPQPIVDTMTKDDQQDEYANITEHDEHYQVQNAKRLMAACAMRHGKPRYAVKRLLSSLSPTEAERGRVDLAVEALLLSTLWHPNIIRMRGVREGDNWQENASFFIVLDCLDYTLDQKIASWKQENSSGSVLCCLGGDLEADLIHKEILFDRLLVARDIASALMYLHDNAKVVYRDLKAENVGFDVRENCKIFDFGLCKPLHSGLKNRSKQGGYLLTPCTGSLPTMAPEIVLGQPYDQSCDVFSFAILLWEILSLKPAFHLFSLPEYRTRVVQSGLRPALGSQRMGFTPAINKLLQQSWQEKTKERPSMTTEKSILQEEQKKISLGGKMSSQISGRTEYLRAVSTMSLNKSQRGSSSFFKRKQKV